MLILTLIFSDQYSNFFRWEWNYFQKNDFLDFFCKISLNLSSKTQSVKSIFKVTTAFFMNGCRECKQHMLDFENVYTLQRCFFLLKLSLMVNILLLSWCGSFNIKYNQNLKICFVLKHIARSIVQKNARTLHVFYQWYFEKIV